MKELSDETKREIDKLVDGIKPSTVTLEERRDYLRAYRDALETIGGSFAEEIPSIEAEIDRLKVAIWQKDMIDGREARKQEHPDEQEQEVRAAIARHNERVEQQRRKQSNFGQEETLGWLRSIREAEAELKEEARQEREREQNVVIHSWEAERETPMTNERRLQYLMERRDYARGVSEGLPGIEAEIEELKAKIEAEKEAPPVWQPEGQGKSYYTVDNGAVEKTAWLHDDMDEGLLVVGHVFPTEEAAEAHLRALKLVETIRRERYKAQGNWWPSMHESRYAMYWYQPENSIDITHTIWSFASSVFGFWQGSNVLRGVIKKHESELEWYFTEYLPSTN